MHSYSVDWYHQVPQHVKGILERLAEGGFQAYIVGGAVRDLWMGKIPKDFDIASNASPEDIERIFPKTTGVGRQFGIMVVVTEEGSVEVARFRTDAAYTDSRHPDQVTFSNPAEDARRRDFTMNALFYDLAKNEVLDYVDGVPDLEARILRCVGDPMERFTEDALRMLRAVRFHAQLEVAVDSTILAAIRSLKARLSAVSKERITQEMWKLLAGSAPHLGIRDLLETGLWEEIFSCPAPENKNALLLLTAKPIEAELLLGALLYLCPGFDPAKCFVVSKEKQKSAQNILSLQKEFLLLEQAELAEQKRILAAPQFLAAWKLYTSANKASVWICGLPELREKWQKENRLDPIPLLTGKDLLGEGFAAGPELKVILEKVRRAQLNEKISTSAEAVKLAKSLCAQQGMGH